LCDFFCTVLEVEVDKRMRQFFCASARWTVFQSRPTFVLSIHVPGHDAETEFPAHSILEVKEQGGSTWYMNRTPQQFGWARST
jgi:hypothetical protein